MGEDKGLPRLPDSEIAALDFERRRVEATQPPPDTSTEESGDNVDS